MDDRREFPRKDVVFKAEISSGGNNYKGVIKNISQSGAGIEIMPTKNAADFVPDSILAVTFQLPTGDVLNLRYEVAWLYSKKFSPEGLKQNAVGVEIKEPSSTLNRFLKDL
ncbi:MAG: PilZ domain-containing protein [Nitrospirae bacterium]|nr:PilZ domain-containing protein [Nitrospirota bacterium]